MNPYSRTTRYRDPDGRRRAAGILPAGAEVQFRDGTYGTVIASNAAATQIAVGDARDWIANERLERVNARTNAQPVPIGRGGPRPHSGRPFSRHMIHNGDRFEVARQPANPETWTVISASPERLEFWAREGDVVIMTPAPTDDAPAA